MEIIRYVTASPISTKAHSYRIHGKGPREKCTANEKLYRLEKYLGRLNRLERKAQATRDPQRLEYIWFKAESLAQRIYSLRLHGKVKRHAYKRLARAEETLRRASGASGESDASYASDTSDTSDTSDASDASDTSSSVKYHITLEEIPDEDGISIY